MAKLRRKCCQCGKVKTAKYRWGTANPKSCSNALGGDGNTYFCSNECALKWFSGVSVTKCSCCEKPLYEGKGILSKRMLWMDFRRRFIALLNAILQTGTVFRLK